MFLDEIGELPLRRCSRSCCACSSAREVRRVGGDAAARRSTCASIAATNRDLRARSTRGTFREDLYSASRSSRVRVPPLRERPEDIPLLVEHVRCARSSRATPRAPLAPATLRQLRAHAWPGNVRELRNDVERRAVIDDIPFATPARARARRGRSSK